MDILTPPPFEPTEKSITIMVPAGSALYWFKAALQLGMEKIEEVKKVHALMGSSSAYDITEACRVLELTVQIVDSVAHINAQEEYSYAQQAQHTDFVVTDRPNLPEQDIEDDPEPGSDGDLGPEQHSN